MVMLSEGQPTNLSTLMVVDAPARWYPVTIAAHCCRGSIEYNGRETFPWRRSRMQAARYNLFVMIQKRYRRIILFFGRMLLSFVAWDLILPRIGFRALSKRTRSERLRQSARAFRQMAVELGGVMIKVGQFLSTRVDVLPDEVINELAGLQDEVPAEVYNEIRKVAESELGEPLQLRFAEFDEVPLAAASLGQVHKARLPAALAEDGTGGAEVVVKIQRPNIELIIATDLAALRTVGRWLHSYKPIRRRADIPALLNEFTRILYEEIDYLAEGRNAETFAWNFRGNRGVRVPKVIWSHTTKRVLTLENVWAIKITEYDEISAAGIRREEVATRLLDTYLQQIFEDGFFHADPHPGNLFVQPLESTDPQGHRDWQLTFVDFGMVGRVPAQMRQGLRELLIGVGTRDTGRVIQAYQMLGVLLPGANLDLLEQATSRVFEHFWGKSMNELQQVSPDQVRQFAVEFRELVYSMPFQIPQDFIFLVRAVGILSGMCTGLDPQFNVWDHLSPFARKLIAEGSGFIWDRIVDEGKILIRSLFGFPGRIDAVLAKIERGEVNVQAPEVNRQLRRIESSMRQVVAAIILVAFLSAGVQFVLSGRYLFGGVLLAGVICCLLWILYLWRRG